MAGRRWGLFDRWVFVVVGCVCWGIWWALSEGCRLACRKLLVGCILRFDWAFVWIVGGCFGGFDRFWCWIPWIVEAWMRYDIRFPRSLHPSAHELTSPKVASYATGFSSRSSQGPDFHSALYSLLRGLVDGCQSGMVEIIDCLALVTTSRFMFGECWRLSGTILYKFSPFFDTYWYPCICTLLLTLEHIITDHHSHCSSQGSRVFNSWGGVIIESEVLVRVIVDVVWVFVFDWRWYWWIANYYDNQLLTCTILCWFRCRRGAIVQGRVEIYTIIGLEESDYELWLGEKWEW